ncbi:MAG: hypothetical protein QOG70_1063 [Solirubrobacteraceae bacterium]|jgi:RNA polymerase sigma factor (sigma-70 family)|nr:hypothetical protein [Solirubrobacteraceae bacterium]
MRPLAHRTDHALVLATAAGNDDAFAALVARHRPRLVRYATSRCGRDLAQAEDAVQDALVRAHRAIVAGKVPADPEAWLFAIVRNRCFDLRRSARPTAELPPELPGGSPSALQALEDGERLVVALDAVGRLPRAQRAALVGRELEGRSYEELADRQATSVSAIKSLLHRARATLAQGASLPALAPLLSRLPRLGGGGGAWPAIGPDQMTGAAAVAVVTLAGAGMLGAVHPPGPPPAPSAAQARAALVAVAHRREPPPAPRRPAGDCSTLALEYGGGCGAEAIAATGERPRSRP